MCSKERYQRLTMIGGFFTLQQFVLTEEEIELKTNLWMAENKDYLIALKGKKSNAKAFKKIQVYS